MLQPNLIISETESSTFHYHLRRLSPEGPQYGGGSNLVALCGKKLGWDTRILLAAWGSESHLKEYWCSQCAGIGNSNEVYHEIVKPDLPVPFAGTWERGEEHESKLTFGTGLVTITVSCALGQGRDAMELWLVETLKAWPHPMAPVSKDEHNYPFYRNEEYQRLLHKHGRA